MTALVHLHAAGGDPAAGCRCVCGVPCGTRETTAYRNLDPERVTCPACQHPAGARVLAGLDAEPGTVTGHDVDMMADGSAAVVVRLDSGRTVWAHGHTFKPAAVPPRCGT